MTTTIAAPVSTRPHMDHKPGPITALIFFGMQAIGLLFSGYSRVNDINKAGGHIVT